MQILVKVETGFNCNWRNIEPLQPEGFKGQTANEKETLKNSIVKNGFHDAFDVWQHDNKLLSIDGVHRKIALLELAAEGYEIPEQMPCTYVTAENETEAATIILSRNSQHSHIIRAAVLMEACAIPAKMIEEIVPQKNIDEWSELKHEDNIIYDKLGDVEDKYTSIVTTPLYEPKNAKPNIKDIYDDTKYKELVSDIEKSNLPNDEKEFLTIAAQRHIIFNYEKIADYYAHSSKECQLQMESSALVIIDFNKAVLLGYVKLSEEIKQQHIEDYGE